MTAREYVDLLMTWVEGQINNEELFPTSVCTCGCVGCGAPVCSVAILLGFAAVVCDHGAACHSPLSRRVRWRLMPALFCTRDPPPVPPPSCPRIISSLWSHVVAW